MSHTDGNDILAEFEEQGSQAGSTTKLGLRTPKEMDNVLTGIWWFIFQQPRPGPPLPRGETYLTGNRFIWAACKQYKRLPYTFIYLFTFFLLADGLNTTSTLVSICQNDKFSFSFLKNTHHGLAQAIASTMRTLGFWYFQRHFKVSTKKNVHRDEHHYHVNTLLGHVGHLDDQNWEPQSAGEGGDASTHPLYWLHLDLDVPKPFIDATSLSSWVVRGIGSPRSSLITLATAIAAVALGAQLRGGPIAVIKHVIESCLEGSGRGIRPCWVLGNNLVLR
ncbi:hypothetical protein BYT27DRAFT_7214905 [Phlegmacium glaucopus]|nr:hypothetical protein BYT27DRAFT_7214905 [Phlegmacium glaucopus]